MLTIIENHESVINTVIAGLNLCVALFAWCAAKKAANAAEKSADIAKDQTEKNVKAQKQNTDLALLEHRVNVFKQLAEWIGYANEICGGRMHYSESLERFYYRVLRKTNDVLPDDVQNYVDVQNDTLMIRLNSERDTILLFRLLFIGLEEKECNMIDTFVNSFIDMIKRIDEEMGKKNSSFYYANRLKKATIAIDEADILERMRNEMRPVQ